VYLHFLPHSHRAAEKIREEFGFWDELHPFLSGVPSVDPIGVSNSSHGVDHSSTAAELFSAKSSQPSSENGDAADDEEAKTSDIDDEFVRNSTTPIDIADDDDELPDIQDLPKKTVVKAEVGDKVRGRRVDSCRFSYLTDEGGGKEEGRDQDRRREREEQGQGEEGEGREARRRGRSQARLRHSRSREVTREGDGKGRRAPGAAPKA
jgi:hypothetical protein